MLTALRLGRFGPVFVSLNYTWLFATVLGLWWLALLWLPDNYPEWSRPLHWLVAALVMLLFLLSVIGREVLRAAISRSGMRNITLYPFGAATPYNLQRIDTSRLLASTIAAIAFNLALGGALLYLSTLFGMGSLLGGDGGFSDVVRGVAIPLGWANIWVGLINLLPAMPFDGARLLTYALYWFTGQLETGLRITRALGEATSLILVLVGAWRGLTTQAWLEALLFVVTGWAAREANENGKQRGMLRNAFAQVRVRDVMDQTNPADAVQATDTVAHMVRSHSRYAPDTLIPVQQNGNALAGIVTVGAADVLLQGDWVTTPVEALMTPTREVEALAPDAPLITAVEMVEDNPLPPEEQPTIAVIENDRLLGGVDPARLEAFEEVDLELGAEGSGGRSGTTTGLGRWMGNIITALMVLAAMAILGNLALNADPYSLGDTGERIPFTFEQLQPLPGSVLDVQAPNGAGDDGSLYLEGTIATAQQIMTASITLDGNPLETRLRSVAEAEGKYTASAGADRLEKGPHMAELLVVTRGARLERTRWEFWVGEKGTPTPIPTPTPVPGVEALAVLRLRPSSGGLVLANEPVTRLSVEIEWPQQPISAAILIDGRRLETNILAVQGERGLYTVIADAPPLAPGEHRVRAEIDGSAGASYATEWYVSAHLPGDDYIYFKETGYFVSQALAEYWRENGGLRIFGYPISDRRQETDEETGETYIAQYFERARIEEHPARGGAIMLGRLGAQIHQPEAPTTIEADARFFPETGHNISGTFRTFWEENGGLEIFGYPISEVKQEVSSGDANEYLVQYFERARFELPVGSAGTASDVQLALLGALVEGR
jgi:hypothetical protein